MRTITLFIALSLLTSCKAQDNNKTTTPTNNAKIMERPIITPEFEKLNLDNFKEGLTKKKETDGPYTGNEFDSYSYQKINDLGITELNGSSLGGFGFSFIAKGSYYDIIKGYYTNNYIKSKCIASNINSSIKIGKQYIFDKEGKLEKTIDHDLGWDYSYEKVIEYILDRKSPLLREEHYWGAEITQEGTEKKYWKLVLDTRKTTNKSTWELIKLDAMTGEILYQIEYEGDRMWLADIQNQLPKQRIIVADKTLDKQKK
jgi:hypothetical protein